LAQNQNNVSE